MAVTCAIFHSIGNFLTVVTCVTLFQKARREISIDALWGFRFVFTPTDPITNWWTSEAWLSWPNMVSTVLVFWGMHSVACELLKPSLITVSCRAAPDQWHRHLHPSLSFVILLKGGDLSFSVPIFPRYDFYIHNHIFLFLTCHYWLCQVFGFHQLLWIVLP